MWMEVPFSDCLCGSISHRYHPCCLEFAHQPIRDRGSPDKALSGVTGMLERIRILVVDDDPYNVDILEQELGHLGYETVSANDGAEALKQVADSAPDLIILDIMMPVMDGFAVCQTLKADDSTRLTPIIIMTALGATEDRVKGIKAGADAFLTKPVAKQELLAQIETVLSQRRAVHDKLNEAKRERDLLAQFVPLVVDELIRANPEAPALEKREHDLSVLFVDIVGYTRLSEFLSAETVHDVVERYFSAFLDCIHDGDGDICETSGDGLMVYFHDPDPGIHAASAVKAALDVLAITTSLNEDNPNPLEIRLGINSGTALLGSSRYQGRQGDRLVYTADGPLINLAARLMGAAKPNQVIVGGETARRVEDEFTVRNLGPRQLKNIAEAVEIYEVCRTCGE